MITASGRKNNVAHAQGASPVSEQGSKDGAPIALIGQLGNIIEDFVAHVAS